MSLKRPGNKVRRLIYFQQLGLLIPCKTNVVRKIASDSSDSHSLHSTDGTLSGEDATGKSAGALSIESEDDDMPMLVDPPHEARSSHIRPRAPPDNRSRRAPDYVADSKPASSAFQYSSRRSAIA